MSDFQYFPGNGYRTYFGLPDDKDLGFEETDNAVFDTAWQAMKGSCVAVRVSGGIDTDRLLQAGALLIRQRNFDARKLARQEIEVILKTVLHEPQEAMFRDNATAQIAVMKFDGIILGD